MQERITRRDVVPCLSATLCVDGAPDVGEIAEEVEAVEHADEVAVEETLRKAGIPDKLVGVHGMVGVASTGVHGEVGGKLQAPRQFDLGGEAVVEVEDVDSLKIYAVAGGVLVVNVADALDLQFGVWTVGQTECLVSIIGADNAV